MQLVDYDETFHEEVGEYLDKSGITKRGFNYHVTAIMGPQSSGKSTLLNMLFGTEFRTMEEQRGRYQVTQGVWLGNDDRSEIVVLDLEGTDSRERGEDAITFERKSALFALALSEVLIVNMWKNDVGRLNAANFGLLRTVLELDLQLFFSGVKDEEEGKDSGDGRFYKTRLLFVVRDDDAVTPFEELCKILRDGVNKIWETIDKPDLAKDMKVDQFFDLDFFAMPHKSLMKEQFREAGEVLKDKFYSGKLFKPEYSRMVTADGFSTYAESVWSTIRDNKELDIPSQKEMVATVRCEQIAREVQEEFTPVLNEMAQALEVHDGMAKNVVPTLFQTLSSAMRKTLQDYDAKVHRYAQNVATEKRHDLCASMMTQSQVLASAQLALVSDMTMTGMKKKVETTCANGEPWIDYDQKVGKWREEAQKHFAQQCGSAVLGEQQDLDDDKVGFLETLSLAKAKLKRDVDELVERTRQNVLSMGKNSCRKQFRDRIETPTEQAIDKAPADQIWDQVSNTNELAWAETRKELAKVIGTGGLDIADVDVCGRVILETREECYGEALSCIKSLIGRENAFLLRVMKRFNDKFRFDERGVPRIFSPNEDIEALFVTAKKEALEMVDACGVIQGGLGLFEKRNSVTLFNQNERSSMKEDMSRQVAAIFMEAKRSQEASRVTSRIPWWLILLLMVVGFDEMVMVLRNPLFLLLGIIVAPLLYLGFSPQAQAYVVPAVTNAARPALMRVRRTLDDYLPPTVPHEHSAASSSQTTAAHPGSSISSFSSPALNTARDNTQVEETG